MAAIPYMPLYIADYMADAAHLSTLEHGAYLLLLMAYWQRGEALPDDDRKLARIAGLTAPNWARIKPTMREFFETSDEKLVHRRVERELAKLRAKSLNNRKGGLARARQSLSERSANAERTLSHTDTDTDTDTDSAVAKATGASAPLASDSDKAFWDNAKAYLGGKNPGGLIGKWIRDFGKDETAKAITAAQLERAVDPIPYIQRVLKKATDGEWEFTGPC